MNIERLIKNTKIKTNPDVNKAVLDDLLNTLDKSKKERSVGVNVWRIVKFAAAAVIIAAVSLFFAYERNERIEKQKIAQTPESKTSETSDSLTTIVSLNAAFSRGGMEAVEKQCSQADKKTRQIANEHITIEELLCELNDCKEI